MQGWGDQFINNYFNKYILFIPFNIKYNIYFLFTYILFIKNRIFSLTEFTPCPSLISRTLYPSRVCMHIKVPIYLLNNSVWSCTKYITYHVHNFICYKRYSKFIFKLIAHSTRLDIPGTSSKRSEFPTKKMISRILIEYLYAVFFFLFFFSFLFFFYQNWKNLTILKHFFTLTVTMPQTIGTNYLL